MVKEYRSCTKEEAFANPTISQWTKFNFNDWHPIHKMRGDGLDGYRFRIPVTTSLRERETDMTREVIEYPKNTSEAINAVANHVYNVATISGFHENDGEIENLKNGRFGDFISNLHGEVSELWEAYRKGKLHQQCDKPVTLTCAEEEISDIIIRCFDTAVTLGIDIGRAIMMKDSYNQTRPYKHGDKRC